MKVVLLLCGIIIGTNVTAENYDENYTSQFKQKKELVPEYKSLNDAETNQQILNICVWTGDTAQSIQLGRRVHPEYNRTESRQIVNSLLLNDKTNPLIIKQVMRVFEDVWDEYTSEVNSTRVFVDQYNKCVRKAKKIINEGSFM